MAGNPLIAQGTLNRLIGSVVWTSFPALNVTAPFLGREGIRLALEGESTTFIPTMTGVVTSPEPYMMIGLTIHLLKTQALSAAYKLQMETSALLGAGYVIPDATTLTPYSIVNCAIESVRELAFDGSDAGWVVSCKGYYNVNSNLYLLTA